MFKIFQRFGRQCSVHLQVSPSLHYSSGRRSLRTRTNGCLLCVAAIQALVSLNEQISTSLVLPDTEQETDFQHQSPHQLQDGGSVASRQQQAFDSSMALMRRLLVDAQVTMLC